MQFINNSEEKDFEMDNILKEAGVDRLATAGIAEQSILKILLSS